MRIVRNTGYVRQRKRNARWMAAIGFLMLTGTFWVAMNPEFLLLSYGFLIFGFIVFNQGMQQLGKWSRPIRNDQILDKHLEKLGEQYTIIHYAQLGRRVVEHLLVYPGGVMVLTAKEFVGDVSAKGRRWTRRGFGLRRIFGISGPQLGNPSIETEISINNVEKFLEEKELEVDVAGAVVFTDPRVDLEVESPDFPILLPDELVQFVQEMPADPSLKPVERQKLVEALSQGEKIETSGSTPRRRPVKRRAA